MKKFLILILAALLTVAANAQIFTHKMILNKFDDVVSECEIKTLITKNDTVIIIEEKGNEPVTYVIRYPSTLLSVGSKDDIVRLVNNVYGYQECWYVLLEKDIKDYVLDNCTLLIEKDESEIDDLIRKLNEKYYYLITHRVVTDQFGTKLLYEYYWIEKVYQNGNYERTIYSSKIY